MTLSRVRKRLTTRAWHRSSKCCFWWKQSRARLLKKTNVTRGFSCATLRPVYTGDFLSRRFDAIFVALKSHPQIACVNGGDFSAIWARFFAAIWMQTDANYKNSGNFNQRLCHWAGCVTNGGVDVVASKKLQITCYFFPLLFRFRFHKQLWNSVAVNELNAL